MGLFECCVLLHQCDSPGTARQQKVRLQRPRVRSAPILLHLTLNIARPFCPVFPNSDWQPTSTPTDDEIASSAGKSRGQREDPRHKSYRKGINRSLSSNALMWITSRHTSRATQHISRTSHNSEWEKWCERRTNRQQQFPHQRTRSERRLPSPRPSCSSRGKQNGLGKLRL